MSDDARAAGRAREASGQEGRGPPRSRIHHRATFIPTISFEPTYIATLVAILGTTISPYLFFWQTSREVEEERAAGRRTRRERRGAAPFLLVLIMLAARNRNVMGRQTIGPVLTALGWIVTIAMFAALAGLAITSFAP